MSTALERLGSGLPMHGISYGLGRWKGRKAVAGRWHALAGTK